MRTSGLLLVALMGALGSGLACAARPSAASATPEGARLTPLDDVVLAPGEFAEVNLEMAAGAATDAAFRATGGALEWNVHSHDGDEVATHAEGAGADGTVRFMAPRAGGYSYLWKNSGSAPVRLTVRLASQGAVHVRSIHPADPAP